MNAEQIQALYEQYGFVIYGRCLRILRDPEDARDAMQSVFLKLIEHSSDLRDTRAVVAWIYRSASNHCFNLMRGSKRMELTDVDMIAGKDPQGRMDARAQLRVLFDVRDRKVRDAAYYTFVEELDQREIGAVTGQSPATIRRNLARFSAHVGAVRRKLGL